MSSRQVCCMQEFVWPFRCPTDLEGRINLSCDRWSLNSNWTFRALPSRSIQAGIRTCTRALQQNTPQSSTPIHKLTNLTSAPKAATSFTPYSKIERPRVYALTTPSSACHQSVWGASLLSRLCCVRTTASIHSPYSCPLLAIPSLALLGWAPDRNASGGDAAHSSVNVLERCTIEGSELVVLSLPVNEPRLQIRHLHGGHRPCQLPFTSRWYPNDCLEV